MSRKEASHIYRPFMPKRTHYTLYCAQCIRMHTALKMTLKKCVEWNKTVYIIMFRGKVELKVVNIYSYSYTVLWIKFTSRKLLVIGSCAEMVEIVITFPFYVIYFPINDELILKLYHKNETPGWLCRLSVWLLISARVTVPRLCLALWKLFGILSLSQPLSCPLFVSKIKIKIWGTWVAQPVKRLTLAQVMISRFMSLSPASSSVLPAQSLEPASDSVSPSLSAPPLLMLCLSLSQKQIRTFKNFLFN